jgi:hypothetical protein
LYCFHCSASKAAPSAEVDHQVASDPVALKPEGGLQEPVSGEPRNTGDVNEPSDSNVQEENLPNSLKTHKDSGNGDCTLGKKKTSRQSQRGKGASKTVK